MTWPTPPVGPTREFQQGSWKDPETVRRFYSGITDQTLAQAMAIHGWCANPVKQ